MLSIAPLQLGVPLESLRVANEIRVSALFVLFTAVFAKTKVGSSGGPPGELEWSINQFLRDWSACRFVRSVFTSIPLRVGPVAIVVTATLALISLRAAPKAVLKSLFVLAHVIYGRIVFVPRLDAFGALSIFAQVQIGSWTSINEPIFISIAIAIVELLKEYVEQLIIVSEGEAVVTSCDAEKFGWAVDPIYELFLLLRNAYTVLSSCNHSDRDILNILKWDELTYCLTVEPLVEWDELLEAVSQGILCLVLI